MGRLSTGFLQGISQPLCAPSALWAEPALVPAHQGAWRCWARAARAISVSPLIKKKLVCREAR